ncbi:MAG: ROK family protein, partial [Microbacterium gubbeenense]
MFRRILSHGPTGRVDIARATGLSQAAVTKAVTPLLDAGFVVAGEAAAQAVGRPISPLSVAAGRAHVIGVKVTSDHTYGVLTGLDARIVARAERALSSSNVTEVVAAVTAVVDELRDSSPTPVEGVGVAVSGDVDRIGGVVRDSPLLRWHDIALADLIENATGLAAEVENDVRALTVTEQMFGAGRNAT